MLVWASPTLLSGVFLNCFQPYSPRQRLSDTVADKAGFGDSNCFPSTCAIGRPPHLLLRFVGTSLDLCSPSLWTFALFILDGTDQTLSSSRSSKYPEITFLLFSDHSSSPILTALFHKPVLSSQLQLVTEYSPNSPICYYTCPRGTCIHSLPPFFKKKKFDLFILIYPYSMHK